MRIFIIASRIPYPLEKGDKLRIYHQIRELSKQHEIYLCCLNDAKIHPQAIQELKKYCTAIEVVALKKWRIAFNLLLALFSSKPFQVAYFYQKQAQKKVNAFLKESKAEAIYAQLIRTTEYVKDNHSVTKTLDYMDCLSKGMERRADISNPFLRPIYTSEAKRLLRYENLIFEYFEHHTIISKQDRDQIWHERRKEIKIVPNGLDAHFFHPKEAKKKFELCFTGNMSYVPNVDAALFLAEEIFPLVLKEKANCKLLIAGANPHPKIQALANENIIVSGWMDDIRDAYWESKVFVAPLRLGSGLQNKLLESMATLTPSITTALANNALGAKEGLAIQIASSPEEFSNKIISMLDDEEGSKAQASAAFQFVTQHYNWEKSSKILSDLIVEGHTS